MMSSALQILAFVLALLGVLGTTVATLLPNWKVSADVGTNIMTAISQMHGLWMDCTWYTTGVFSCTLKYSVLSLPAYLQTARTTMVLSCMAGSLGLCLASLGLRCTRWGGSHRAKGRTAVAAGGCFVVASVLCLVAASWYTDEVIASFLDPGVPENAKYEPGGAIYVTFISAGFLLAGGFILCLSCPGKRDTLAGTTSLDLATSPTGDPGKLLEQLRRERLRRELLEQERELQRKRDTEAAKEELSGDKASLQQQPQPAQPQPAASGSHRNVEESTSDDDSPQAERPKYYSPSRLPPKDVKAGYTLKHYV